MKMVEPLLGTRAEVAADAADQAIVEQLEDAVLEEVERLESIFSVFDTDAAIQDLRRTGRTTVPELLAVAELARHWHHRTDGAFNPTMQPLVDAWGQGEVDDVVPDEGRLVELVAQARLLPVQYLDLNAVAKGWIAQHAVDRVIEHHTATGTEARGIWLSLGGDVVHRGAGGVVVGIEDPHRPYDNVAPMASVELRNEAMATSGSARRWWTIGGRRYAKVLDPRTGQPVDHVVGASVVAPDAAAADALATAALVLPPERSQQLIEDAGGACWLVLADRTVVASGDRFRPA